MSEGTICNINYVGINQKVELADRNSSILDCSITNQIAHLHECGGHAQCTTCRIRIIEGHENVTPRTLKEKDIARIRKWDPSIRLACQCYVKGDVSIQRLVWTSSEVNKLQLETVPEDTAEERAIAILFCDIRGFTKIASDHGNFDTAYILNRFYTVLGDPIIVNNGIIYQYVGDEIIGLFGVAGGMRDKNCQDAVRAALGMKFAVERLNHTELLDFDTKIEMGIGVNFGKAFIGHLGHPKHKQFAVVGDPVNTASRIQSYNKESGTSILISETIYEALSSDVLDIGTTLSIQLSGHEHATILRELVGFKKMDVQLELQHSLDYMLRNEDLFAEQFYQRVFDRDPAIRLLFKNNMMSQGRLLTHMLGSIVYSLSRPEHLEMGLRALGRSHFKYGVKDEHYPIIFDSMMETIREQLGDYYSDNIGAAWDQALTYVTSEMKKHIET